MVIKNPSGEWCFEGSGLTVAQPVCVDPLNKKFGFPRVLAIHEQGQARSQDLNCYLFRRSLSLQSWKSCMHKFIFLLIKVACSRDSTIADRVGHGLLPPWTEGQWLLRPCDHDKQKYTFTHAGFPPLVRAVSRNF